MLETAVRPRGPYSLALSARRAGDATRRFRDGVFVASFGAGEPAWAWQRPDGSVVLRAAEADGIDRLRFVLALDDDHSAFLCRFARDPLLRRAVVHLRGLRPIRVATVAHALLRALCGQLIEARLARQIERRVIRAATTESAGLYAPPSPDDLARFAPAELRALGLHARRAATLVRLCRTLDLERLKDLPTAAAAGRLERERGLGPWSVGVVSLEGLGRPELGLVGDLALVKLCAALWGRWVEGWETAELLAPYGEWQGLAGVYLMAAFGRGLVPGAIHSVRGTRRAQAGGSGRGEDRRVADRRPPLLGLAETG